MPNSRGFVPFHLLTVVFVVAGIFLGILLVKNPTFFKPRASYLPGDVAIEGKISGVVADDFENQKSETAYYIEPLDQPGVFYRLELPEETELETGIRAKISGNLKENEILQVSPESLIQFQEMSKEQVSPRPSATASGSASPRPTRVPSPSPSMTPSPSPTPPPTPTPTPEPSPDPESIRKTALVILTFDDYTTHWFTASEYVGFIQKNDRSARKYLREVSGGRYTLALDESSDVYRVNLPTSKENCEQYVWQKWHQEFLPLIRSKVPTTEYKHVITALPNDNKCPFGGLGNYYGGNEIGYVVVNARGSKPEEGPNREYYERFSQNQMQTILAHELGHNLGLRHSDRLECTQFPVNSGDCKAIAVRDFSSSMGVAVGDFVPLYHAYNRDFLWAERNFLSKEFIHWPFNSELNKLDAGKNRYTLLPLESPNDGVKYIKINMPNEVYSEYDKSEYFISYRSSQQFVSRLPDIYTGGVNIHIAQRFKSSLLLDFDTTKENSKAYLTNGESYYDPINKIRITQIDSNPNGVIVEVSVGE